MREQPTSTHKRRVLAGFSLVELMTVIVIVGILSAIAIPTFSGYVFKSRTGEATQFLGAIKLREESYRSEFGQYCNTAQASTATTCATLAADLQGFNTTGNYMPDSAGAGKNPRPWTSNLFWNELGARPGGEVRFSYAVAAGAPATAAGLVDSHGATMGWTAATADFWWVAHAVGDLDGDGTQVTFETYSAGNQMWIGDANGAAISQGWE